MKLDTARNILVLGANSDIGSEIVRIACNNPSRKIVAVSRSPQTAANSQESNVHRVGGIDLTVEADLLRLAKIVDDQFDSPFSVIHSVGDFWSHKPICQTQFGEIKTMLESQVLTLFGVARFLTPVMMNKKGGRIVAFSCNSVVYSYPDMAPFTASKAAIEAFVRCYANEHSEFGISATALALPTIKTKTVLVEKPDGDHKNYIAPDDLANFILDHIVEQPHDVNGNVIKVFKHSPSFYHSSYYARNPRK